MGSLEHTMKVKANQCEVFQEHARAESYYSWLFHVLR